MFKQFYQDVVMLRGYKDSMKECKLHILEVRVAIATYIILSISISILSRKYKFLCRIVKTHWTDVVTNKCINVPIIVQFTSYCSYQESVHLQSKPLCKIPYGDLLIQII